MTAQKVWYSIYYTLFTMHADGTITILTFTSEHRFNTKLDLQSLFGLLVTSVLYSLAETPQLPPSPAVGLICEGAIGQPRKTTSLCKLPFLSFVG